MQVDAERLNRRVGCMDGHLGHIWKIRSRVPLLALRSWLLQAVSFPPFQEKRLHLTVGVKKRVVTVGHVMLCLKGVLYPLMQLYPFKKNTDTQFSKSWLWLFLMVYVFSFPFLDCLPLPLNHRTILAPKNPLGNVNMSEMGLSAGLFHSIHPVLGPLQNQHRKQVWD